VAGPNLACGAQMPRSTAKEGRVSIPTYRLAARVATGGRQERIAAHQSREGAGSLCRLRLGAV